MISPERSIESGRDAGMNHAFVAALAEACETAESLADRIGLHPKTVARWANPGRIPQTRHRAEVAQILRKDVAELWPDVLNRRERRARGSASHPDP
jgi:hypothetical protein